MLLHSETASGAFYYISIFNLLSFLLLNKSCFWLFDNTAHVLDIVKDNENHS